MYSLEYLCCLCVKENSVYINFYDKNEDGLRYVDIVKFLFPDLVIPKCKVSMVICSTCCELLKQLNHFKKQCINSLKTKKENAGNLISTVLNSVKPVIKLPEILEDHNYFEIPNDENGKTSVKFQEHQLKNPSAEEPIKTSNSKTTTNSADSKKFFICDTCNGEFPSIRSLNVHKSWHLKEKRDKEVPPVEEEVVISSETVWCPKKSVVDTETFYADKIENFYVCKKCNKQLASFRSLQRHMLNHTGATSFDEDYKEETVDDPDFLEDSDTSFEDVEELKQSDEEVEPSVASLSRDVDLEKDMLSRHFSTFEAYLPDKPKRQYVCKLCDQKLSCKSSLRKHMMRHSGQKRFLCIVCGIRVFTPFELRNHMLCHQDERPFKCEECQSTFKSKYRLNHHMKRHSGARPHTCPICCKAFRYPRDLRKHQLVHSDEKPFQCPACKKRYRTDNAVRYHRCIKSDRTYPCKPCNRVFTTYWNYEKHRRKEHQGKIPQPPKDGFLCNICGKDFALKSTLNTHMLIHTGERPHECHLCGRKFVQSNALKTHIWLLHTSERPYRCNVCHKGFNKAHLYENHIKTHKKLTRSKNSMYLELRKACEKI